MLQNDDLVMLIDSGLVKMTVYVMEKEAYSKWRRRRWQPLYGLLTNCAIMWGVFAVFVNDFVHNVSATVSWDGREGC